MNVIEAYIKYAKHLVIFISGVSGSGISHLAKKMSKDLKISHLSYAKFCRPDYNKKVTLPSGAEVINWDTDDVIDWELFNQAIKNESPKGIIAYAPAFPISKLDPLIIVTAHINIKLSKKNLYSRRVKYIKEHPEECEPITPDDLLIFNRYTFPHYLQSQENSVITKYLNANEFAEDTQDNYDEKLADEAFKYIINVIEKWLEKNRPPDKNPSDKSPIEDSDDDDNELEDEGYSILYR